MQSNRLYAGTFMVVFMVCGLFLALTTVFSISKKVNQPTLPDVVEGRWTLAFEKLFDENIDIKEKGTDFWGAVNYGLFKNGKAGVVIGDNGWLFTNEEFMQYPGPKKQIQAKIDFVKQVRDVLNAHGVKMVVALVPSKARLYEDSLGRYTYPAYNASNYQIFRAGMKGANIPVTDILWLMNQKKDEDFDLFLKTDTHWAPAGARMAARLVVNEANRAYPGLIVPETTYTVAYGETEKHEGDLLRYVPLGRWASYFDVETDYIKKIILEEKQPAQADASADLFGEQDIPVTLVGTSYSANSKWGFADFLKESFGTDVLNAADEGMGPFETMKKYLNDGAFKKTPPKLLVWEIPERYLPVKYDLDIEGVN